MKTATVVASVTRRAGGIFDSLVGTCRELSRLPPAEEVVLSLDDGSAPEDLKRWVGVTLQRFRVEGPKRFGYSAELKHALFAGAFDLVHSHGLWQYPSVAINVWHRRTHRPHLVSPHGMLDPWALRNSAVKKRIAGLLFEHKHLRSAACIRALCEAEAHAIRAFGLTNPICLIPNGIDVPRVGSSLEDHDENAALPTRHTVAMVNGLKKDGRRTLLFLGRIHPKKGLITLLKGWHLAVAGGAVGSGCEWALLLAGWGQGGHENQLKEVATQLGLGWADAREQRPTVCGAGSVVFLGPQFGDDKDTLLRRADAFILPSFSEGQPMAVLEAWSYGKPVLMTPQCNLPEGFAADAAIRIEPTVESIAEGLRTMMSAPTSALEAIGQNGRKLVAERFSWPRIARQMISVYEWVLGHGEKPSCVV